MKQSLIAEPRHCAQCGVVLSVYSLEGVCGNCLLKPGLGPMTEPLDDREDESHFPALVARSNRSSNTEEVGRFGDYELLEEIARGGMGIVYRARQVSLDRIVAVKMLLAGPLAGKDFVQRFRTEAAAAASLHHPNIVAIHEVGFAQGQHFFAMDFVEGLTLAQLVAKGPLPPRQAATYLKTVAEAIHFAHERNVLHRDLKPSNVLVDSATDQPRVTDFGLAKRLEAETDLTLSGQLLGSPNYMSPEQARANRGTVGKRSDVYSLGAILYHLLTGRPPFQGETLTEVLRQLADTDPLAPHLLIPRVPPDLETICVKCLEKEPAKRYQSAQELAEELGRFLRNEPIQARPVTRAERTWRWCRRNPALASLGGSLVLVVALGFTSTLWQWRQAMHNSEAEAKERQRAEENLYFAEMHGAETALADGDLGRARELVEAHWPKAGQVDLRDFEWRLLWQRCRGDDLYALRGHSNLVNALRFSPDGDTLATRSLDNHLKVWDLTTRTERFAFTNVTTLGGFTTDGQAFAFGTGDGSVKLCEARTGRILHSLEKAGDLVALLADGKTVATTAEGFIVKLWDIASGQKMSELPGKGGINVWLPEFGAGVVITPDGKKLAVSNGFTNGLGMGVTLWDVATREIVKPSFDKRELTLTFLVLSPDGKVLATGGGDGLVRFWDMATGDELGPRLQAHSEPVVSAAFSPDGQVLATASLDQTIRLWDLAMWREFATWREPDTLKGHDSGVWVVTFSADGRRLASGGLDQTVRLWNTARRPVKRALSDLPDGPVIWSPDSKLLAGSSQDRTNKVWDAATLETRTTLPGVDSVLTFSDHGKTILATFEDGSVKYCDVATGKVTREGPKAPSGEWTRVVISADGRSAAIADNTPIIRLWDIASGKIEPLTGSTRVPFAVAISSDGHMLISGGLAGFIDIWDVARRQCVESIAAHSARVVSVAISPDGTVAASGSTDTTIKLWNVKTTNCLATLKGHKRPVWLLAFSPDGQTLASESGDHTVRLWNVSLRREAAILRIFTSSNPGVPEEINSLNFSPDGNTLAAVTHRGILKLFRAATLDEMARRPGSATGRPNAAQ